jgi:hypothetical protein
MAQKSSTPDALFGTRWVHVYEQDSAQGAVYRREDDDVPLSRRPRERLELRADGSALLFAPGPDDRLVEQQATWREESGVVVVRTRDSELRIIDRSPDRLVVQTQSR